MGGEQAAVQREEQVRAAEQQEQGAEDPVVDRKQGDGAQGEAGAVGAGAPVPLRSRSARLSCSVRMPPKNTITAQNWKAMGTNRYRGSERPKWR